MTKYFVLLRKPGSPRVYGGCLGGLKHHLQNFTMCKEASRSYCTDTTASFIYVWAIKRWKELEGIREANPKVEVSLTF